METKTHLLNHEWNFSWVSGRLFSGSRMKYVEDVSTPFVYTEAGSEVKDVKWACRKCREGMRDTQRLRNKGILSQGRCWITLKCREQSYNFLISMYKNQMPLHICFINITLSKMRTVGTLSHRSRLTVRLSSFFLNIFTAVVWVGDSRDTFISSATPFINSSGAR